MANKSHRFRIYPNIEQQTFFQKTFGCVRFIYNYMLTDKNTHYQETGQRITITPAQYKDDYPWLREVDSLSLANAQLHLEAAYRNFFRDKSVGFPKFKSKHKGHNSYTTNLVKTNISLSDGYLKLPKIGMVKIVQHRPIPDGHRLKSVTISQVPSGRYFASIMYEYDANTELVKPVNILGLDFSMKELYVDSNGSSPAYPRYYRKAQCKLAKEQRKLSRKQQGGSNYKKQKHKVACVHEHIANQRSDFLHKQSRQIANAYDAVCIEDLNMKAMSQALNFGKSVSDNGWGMFTRMLDYKLSEQGKRLVKIDKWFPSSKMCSNCGTVKEKLSLSERTYHCDCGFICDRDLNAAINIRNIGTAMLA